MRKKIGWSEDELGDIVVEPLPADRIVRCGGEPFRTEDGPDDRRRREKGMHAIKRDPAANREHDEEQDARFQEPQDRSEQLIDDAEGGDPFDEPAQALIEQNGGELDEHDEQHERNGDGEPLRKHAAEHHGGRGACRDGLDGRKRARDDGAGQPADVERFERALDVCARNIGGKGREQRLVLEAIC